MKSVLIYVLLLSGLLYVSGQSCVGRCGVNDGVSACQCNSVCGDFGDCCSDYTVVCFSCKDRCDEGYLVTKPCQCNDECSSFGNCCSDYDVECGGGSGGTLTDQDIINYMEQIYALDVNSVADKVVYDSSNTAGDLFVSVDADVLTGPTIAPFMALRDNYFVNAAQTEDETAAERVEIDAFLDAILATPLMQYTEEFMSNYSMIPQFADLRAALDQIWFSFYDRGGGTNSACGFEHSFIGEISGGVSGYHNWLSFYTDETEGELQYTACLGDMPISTLPQKIQSVFMMSFNWLQESKPISSMWMGSSPELEMAAYTVAFFYRSNSLVDASMNGQSFQIQTYTIGTGDQVGSAYPDINQIGC